MESRLPDSKDSTNILNFPVQYYTVGVDINRWIGSREKIRSFGSLTMNRQSMSTSQLGGIDEMIIMDYPQIIKKEQQLV